MSIRPEDLEDFVCNEVTSLCDADPKVLAQYIIALIGKEEHNDALRASLEDKLQEFFEDQTTLFIDRLFVKLNGSSKPSKETDRFNTYSDEEDDDGDRNFKHSRARPETRDRTDLPEQNKRRYADENSYNSNKHFRSNNNDDKRSQYNIPSGSSGYSAFDRGRGRGSGRGFVGRGPVKPPMCRDYMEKGYCMSGDTCPFDHGRDRIIVEDTNNNNYVQPAGNISMIPNRLNQPVNVNDAYDPERATLLPTNHSGIPNDIRNPMQSRRGGFRGGARGGRGGSRNHSANNPTNTTLIVEKIPLESCQISIVNEFFSKFGTITNINVQSHAQKAIIQYGTRAEAERAYTCPDAVFDNRFVKVYWSKDDSVSSSNATGANAINANTTGVNVTGANSAGVNIASTNASGIAPFTETPDQENPNKRKADEPDPEAVAARAAELAKIREEKHKKHQEHMKAILEVQKKREQQLKQQIEEQKRLFEKLSNSTNMSIEEKTEILKQLKNVEADINNSKKAELTPSTDNISDNKEQTATELQKKIETLEAKASYIGADYLYSARGGYFGRGRGGLPRSRGGLTRMSLDNRTTKIDIKDIPEDTTEEELRAHFENYGQVTLFQMQQPEALVQYSQRYLAEKAMFYAPNFPKGKLQLSWSYETSKIPTESVETAETAESIKPVTAAEPPADSIPAPTETS